VCILSLKVVSGPSNGVLVILMQRCTVPDDRAGYVRVDHIRQTSTPHPLEYWLEMECLDSQLN